VINTGQCTAGIVRGVASTDGVRVVRNVTSRSAASRPRWSAVRSTLAKTCCLSAPRAVRLGSLLCGRWLQSVRFVRIFPRHCGEWRWSMIPSDLGSPHCRRHHAYIRNWITSHQSPSVYQSWARSLEAKAFHKNH